MSTSSLLRRCIGAGFVLSFGLICSALTLAQAPAVTPNVADQTGVPTTVGSSHSLRVAINPSTAHIVEGAVYGLDTEFENTSIYPITLDLSKVMLTVQPELAPPNVACTWFYLVTANDKVTSPMVLLPGDHFTVFFDTGSKAEESEISKNASCKAGFWERRRKSLDFVPGNYAFVLTGTFLTNTTGSKSGAMAPVTAPKTAEAGAPSSVGAKPSTETAGKTSESSSADAGSGVEEHFFTATASFPVVIDQYQIILYASLGGLLGWLVTSFRNADSLAEYAGKAQASSNNVLPKVLFILRKMFGAVFTSVAVTIAASRLANTSFPIKVSVEDFWGALTIGFVSYFVGGKFIDKLSDTLASDPSPKAGQPAPSEKPAAPKDQGGYYEKTPLG